MMTPERTDYAYRACDRHVCEAQADSVRSVDVKQNGTAWDSEEMKGAAPPPRAQKRQRPTHLANLW